MNQSTQDTLGTSPIHSDVPAGADSSHDISVLNSLIEVTLDSAEGYGEAVNDEETGQFGSIFAERASERRQAVTLLQDEVRRLGGEPEDSGSILGGMHRMFTKIKAMATQRDDALIREVENGEDYIKNKFESALADTRLMPTTRTAIRQVFESVQAGHDQMSQLKHAVSDKRGLPNIPDGI